MSFDAIDARRRECLSQPLRGWTESADFRLAETDRTSTPRQAGDPFPVQLDHEHRLRVDIRDQLVNVTVDGQLVVAYRLALPDSRAGSPSGHSTRRLSSSTFVWIRCRTPSTSWRRRPEADRSPRDDRGGMPARSSRRRRTLVFTAEKALAISRADVAAMRSQDRSRPREICRPSRCRISTASRGAASRADRGASLLKAEEKQRGAEGA